MSDWRLIEGDCLEVMRSMPDCSVDLVCTDPPYYRVKGEAWDKQWANEHAFLDWMRLLSGEWQRILKPNGSLYVFASPRMAARVEVLMGERFSILNRIRWVKADGWHLKTQKEALRSYLSPYEEIIFAEQQLDRTVAYLRSECVEAGLTPAQLSGLLGFKPTGGSIAPRRYLNVGGFAPIAREQWATLQRKTGRFALNYDEVYRPFTLTAGVPCTDVWDFPIVPAYPGKHPCEKPATLIRHIIRTSSIEGAVVFDGFMGSGVVGEVAIQEGRNFIGCDRDALWVRRAGRRIQAVYTQPEQATMELVS